MFVFVYLAGAALFLWPERIAFFGSRWMYRSEPELSDAGLMWEQFGGLLLMGAAVVTLFLAGLR